MVFPLLPKAILALIEPSTSRVSVVSVVVVHVGEELDPAPDGDVAEEELGGPERGKQWHQRKIKVRKNELVDGL